MNDIVKLLCRPAFVWGAAGVCGAAAGGYTALYGGVGTAAVLLFAVLAAFLAGLIHIFRARAGGRTYLCTVWTLTFIFAASGFFRVAEEVRPGELDDILVKGTNATVTGTADYISVRPDGYRITLKSARVAIGDKSVETDGILLSINMGPEFGPEPGDIITAKGRIYPLERATNPGQFDSAGYYRVKRIRARFNASEAFIEAPGKPGIKTILYHIRTYLSNNIFRILPSEEASVLNSILTGDRGMLENDLKDLYSEGGIAHILSISSLHVSLLGLGIYRLLIKLTSRMKPSIAITLFILYCYLILTGCSVSTFRAVIMLTVLLLAKLLGRGYDLLNTAGLSAFILLMIQPLYIYDTGFRLSFLAVLGIFAAGELTRLWEIKHVIARSLIMSSFVWLFTLPVVLSSYFCVNLFSVLVNVIILPMMSILLPAGYIAAVTGFTPVAGPVYYILRLYTSICEWESDIPFIRPVVGAPTTAEIVAYYALIVLLLLVVSRKPFLKEKKKTKILYAPEKSKRREGRRNLPVLLLLLGCAVIFVRPSAVNAYAAFLDVGQGDAIYIEADGEKMLMDAGSSNVSNVGEYRVIPFLKHRGVRRLDRVIISHMDKDHISAVKEMLELGYPEIGELIVSVHTDPACDLVVLAEEKGVPVRYVSAGETLGSITFLAPEAGRRYSDANSASVVALLRTEGFNLLLTGDSGFESEKLYTSRLIERSAGFTVLKCAHHGSKYSSSAEMLSAADPAVTVISCYKYNTYGHPNPLTLERLAAAGSDVYCTADSGAVLIDVSDSIKVEEYGRYPGIP